MATSTFATAFPTTPPTTTTTTTTTVPSGSSSLKRRMPQPPHAPTWPNYSYGYDTGTPAVTMTMQHHEQTLQLQQQQQQPSFKRVRLSHSSPGELCLQRDLKSLSNSHQWNYQPYGQCWVYEQDPKIRLHHSSNHSNHSNSNHSNSNPMGGGDQQLLLEFCSQNANIAIQIPRMYPHETPRVTKIQGLWMDSIHIVRSQQQSQSCFQQTATATTTNANNNNNKTVVFDHWSPIVNLSTLLEFCIAHARMQPRGDSCLGERTNTLHHHHNHHHPSTTTTPAKTHHHHHRRPPPPALHHNSNNNNHNNNHNNNTEENNHQNQMMMNGRMEISHPCKYTSPFAPNRFDVGYNKEQQQQQQQHQHQQGYHHGEQQPPSQDAMEM